MQPFERLLVLGCGGAGKSTLSTELSGLIGLPVVHLDKIYWRPGWQHVSREEFDTALAAELAKPRWIIDGNFSRTLAMRLESCDAVVLLDYPAAVCLGGVLRRQITYAGRTRESMGEGCPEHIDPEFLRWVCDFRRDTRPELLELLRQASQKEHPPQIFIFKNRKQTRRWLNAAGASVGAARPDEQQPG